MGKSTLFNRLVGRRQALVEDLPGTTRDRLYSSVEWRGKAFVVVDSGGWQPGERADPEGLAPLVQHQVETALAEAEAILFLVDAREGITATDQELAQRLRRAGWRCPDSSGQKPLLLVANKADNEARLLQAQEFYELGLGEPLAISAYHGLGVAEVLDRLWEILPPGPLEESTALPLAIVGRPNVGKSLLLNTLLGQERAIVSELPGTTRDAIDTPFEYDGQKLLLIDTAGLRRRSRRREEVEQHAALRAQRAIRRAEVALLVVDATEPATDQDSQIAQAVAEAYKGLVVVVNKWDLVVGQEEQALYARRVRRRLPFAPWAPLCFISAKEAWGLQEMMGLALAAWEARRRRVPTAQVNQAVQRAVARSAPPSPGGRRLNVLYATQAEICPPTFVFFVNDPSLLAAPYQRYLERALRQAFSFQGTALKLVFRARRA